MKKVSINNILEILKTLALKSDVSNKHSAALVKNNTVYTSAYNKFIKKETVNDKIYHITIHAEINAVYTYYNKKNIKNCDLIVVRVNNDGTAFKNSRPCNQCINKLLKLGISKVYYSDSNGEMVYEYLNKMELIHDCSGYTNYNKN
jgi:deoxycytidylate deaminase